MNSYNLVTRTLQLTMLIILAAPLTIASAESSRLAETNLHAKAWQQTLQVQLPAPTRSVLLSNSTNTGDWIALNKLSDTSVTQIGRNSLVEFPMSDRRWADGKEICGQPGVSQCETTQCQTIQVRAATVGARNTDAVKGQIVKRSAAVEDVPEATDADDGDTYGTCRDPAALAAPTTAEQAGVGGHLNLQLDLRNRRLGLSSSNAQYTSPNSDASSALVNPQSTQVPQTTAPATANSAEPSAAETGSSLTDNPTKVEDLAANGESKTSEGTNNTSDQRSDSAEAKDDSPGNTKFSLSQLAGGIFSADTLPADSTDYTLVVGEGCQSVKIPLDSVSPALVPNMLTALVQAGTAEEIAQRNGLSLLTTTPLVSVDAELALFFTLAKNPLDIMQSLGLLRLDSDILAAQPEYIYRSTATGGVEYSDPFAQFNYGPEQTGAVLLHDSVTGSSQTIAVIDTGVAVDHVDLQGRVEPHDFTDRGFSADLHGTAVASIIAAEADNARGSYGVAPKAKILALKACHPTAPGKLEARCWTSSIVKALDFAIQQDVQVINMSLTGPPDELVAQFVNTALDNNQLIVAGAGNGGASANPAFPAALEGVLAITAIDRFTNAYKDANQGRYIDFAAPGVDIVTPTADGAFNSSSGTSWAAAHVSGLAALVRDLVPLLSAQETAALLIASSKDLGQIGRDSTFGFGIVDVCKAATSASADAVSCARSTDAGEH